MPSPRINAVLRSRHLDVFQFVAIGAAFCLAMLLANSPYSHLYDILLDTRFSGAWLAIEAVNSPLYWLNEVLVVPMFCWAGWFAAAGWRHSARQKVTAKMGDAIVISLAALPPMIAFWFWHRPLTPFADAAVLPAATDPLVLASLLALLASRLGPSGQSNLVFIVVVQSLSLLMLTTLNQLDFWGLILALAFPGVLLGLRVWSNHWLSLCTCIALAAVFWWVLLKAEAPAALAAVVLGGCLSKRGDGGFQFGNLPYRMVALMVVPIFVLANAGTALRGLDPAYIWRNEPLSFLVTAGLLKPLCVFLLLLGLQRSAGKWFEDCTAITLLGLAVLSAVGFCGAAYFSEFFYSGVPGNFRFDLRLAALWVALLAAVIGAGLVLGKDLGLTSKRLGHDE